MVRKTRSDKLYLSDIIVSMKKIIEFTKNVTFDDFINDVKTYDAVIRNFEIIGEASNKLSEDIKAKINEIPWQEMYLLRNRLSHEYFGIDDNILWDIIQNHLPKNLEIIKKVTK